MKKLLLAVLLTLITLLSPAQSFAQNSAPQTQSNYYKGQVTWIVSEGEKKVLDKEVPYQTVKVKLLDGPQKDQEVTVAQGTETTMTKDQRVNVGDTVIVMQLVTDNKSNYFITDRYRLPSLIILTILFFILVVGLSRLKGLGSIAGLIVSILVISQFIVPAILAGQDPLLVSAVGAAGIICITIYLAHGFSFKTTLALVSTLITLVVVCILSVVFVNITHLTGLGSDDAALLQFGPTGSINVKGLLLGGIIIGAIGVLDDVTTGLTAALYEIKQLHPTATFGRYLKSGMNIGNEHISSLVNTLVLAYAGASLPLFLFFIINPSHQPLWMILNNELIAEEIVRTLAGSFGLVLAVPITILITAYYLAREK